MEEVQLKTKLPDKCCTPFLFTTFHLCYKTDFLFAKSQGPQLEVTLGIFF